MTRQSGKQSERLPNNAAQGYLSAALSGEGSLPVNVPLPLSMINGHISVTTCPIGIQQFLCCYVQGPCLEVPSVSVCSPLTSSGRACKQMPPGMLCRVQWAHCARLCRRKVSGLFLCLASILPAALSSPDNKSPTYVDGRACTASGVQQCSREWECYSIASVQGTLERDRAYYSEAECGAWSPDVRLGKPERGLSMATCGLSGRDEG